MRATELDPEQGKDGSLDAASPVRVLWLIKGLGPGGAEGLLVAHARHRARQDITYRVVYILERWSHRAGELRATGLDVRCLDGGPEWDLRWALDLRRLLIEDPVDVVHVHSPYAASVARLLVRTLPRPRPALVYTEHNRWTHHQGLTRTMNRLTYGLDDATIAVSDSVRSTIKHRRAPEAQVVIHGIDAGAVVGTPEGRSRVRAELGVGDDEVLVGTVANLKASKAYPVLLEAARLVVDSGRPVRFLAAGVGPEQDHLERVHAELGLGERFRFLGFRDDVVDLLSALDIFVLASDGEALGIAVLEAMAAGLAVVATDSGGIPEVVTDQVDGRLVVPNSSEELAATILELAQDPQQRDRLGGAARQASARFDIGGAVRSIEDLYRRLARGRPRVNPSMAANRSRPWLPGRRH